MCAGESGAPSPDQAGVVAVVDGTPITLGEFERQRPLALFQAKNTFYEAEKKAVDTYLDDYILERQARKENVSVPRLLELHVNATIAKDPTDESLEIYYEGLDTTEAFDTMKVKIRDHIRERRIGKAKDAYLQSLRKEARIEIQVEGPRATVSAGAAPMRGTTSAPLTLIEYADYECPYCQQSAPDLAKIEAAYQGKLAFVYKDFPLPMHPHAQKAAEAAQCAGAQNKYWEYHDLLLTTKQLEMPDLKAAASTLDLDTAAFNTCLDSGQKSSVVKANMDEGIELGVTGTPSFFLNGKFISGSLPFEQFHQVLDEELKAVAVPARQTAKN